MNGSHASPAIAVVALGVALGLGSYTFAYARGCVESENSNGLHLPASADVFGAG